MSDEGLVERVKVATKGGTVCHPGDPGNCYISDMAARAILREVAEAVEGASHEHPVEVGHQWFWVAEWIREQAEGHGGDRQ